MKAADMKLSYDNTAVLVRKRGLGKVFLWIRAFVRRDLLTEISYRANFLFGIAGGLFSVLLFFFLSQMVESAAPGLSGYQGGYFPFVLAGLAVMVFLNEALNGFSRSVRQAQLLGTLEAVLATPVSPGAAILCQSVQPMIGASLRAAIYLVFGLVIFDAGQMSPHYTGALAALVLGVACFAAMGIMSAAATMVLKRGDPVAWAIGGLSVLLGGVYYPVEVLPPELQAFAFILPMTHCLQALREALLGDGGELMIAALRNLLIFAIVLVPLSILVFSRAVRFARREGSLTHF